MDRAEQARIRLTRHPAPDNPTRSGPARLGPFLTRRINPPHAVIDPLLFRLSVPHAGPHTSLPTSQAHTSHTFATTPPVTNLARPAPTSQTHTCRFGPALTDQSSLAPRHLTSYPYLTDET